MKIKGEVHYKVFENGKLVQEETLKNLVVDGGKDAIAKLIGNLNASKFVDQIGFGEGTSTPAGADSSLTNHFIKAVSSVTTPAINKVTFHWSLTTGEGNGMNITEFGLFTNDNFLFARRLALSTIVKNNTISIAGTWTLTF